MSSSYTQSMFVILPFILSFPSANSYFINWSTSKGCTSLLDTGDCQFPLPSFTFFLSYTVPFQSVYYTSPNLPLDISISVLGIFPTPVSQAHDWRILFSLFFYPQQSLRPFWAPSAVFLISISSISFAFFLLLPGTHYLLSGCPPTHSLQFCQMNLSKAHVCIHFNQQ